MDTALISFLKDKSQYLKEFSLGQHIANPVLLGIILSFNQQELGEDLSLLESLDRLITDLHEPAHVSYCLIKFYKASGDYLQSSSSPNAKFAQIYYRTSMSLLDFQVIPSVKPLISNQFIHCFELFMKKYSKSTDFAKILVIGKKNIKLFQNVPVVLTSGIDENLIKISRVREEISLQNVFVSLDSLLRGLLGKDLGKMPEVMVFTKEIIEIIYKERASKEVLSEFSAKLPEFAMLFDIETRLKFDGLHREACQKIGLQNITGVFLGLQNISGVIKNVESRLIQIPVLENPQPVIIPLNKPKSIVKIPERGYNYIEPEVKDVGKDEPPAFITESLNQQTVDILIDIISEYRTQWGKTQVVNTIDVKNGFESIANYSIDFKRELQSSFKQLIEKEKDKNSLDFWKQIIEAAELYLDQNEIDFLLVLAFEKIDKYEDYDRQENIRGRGNLRKRPNSRGAARNSGYSDRSDLDFNWENVITI